MRARDCFSRCFSVTASRHQPAKPNAKSTTSTTTPPTPQHTPATTDASGGATAAIRPARPDDEPSTSDSGSSSPSSSSSPGSPSSASVPPAGSGAGPPGAQPPAGHCLPAAFRHFPDNKLWRIIATMIAEPPRRRRLAAVATLAAVVQLIGQSRNILVLTGAGVSVSCGIPDFRSRDGVYRRLRAEYPELPDPQAMFNIRYFAQDPRPFYRFAREIFPGQFRPSASHRFIRLLERRGRLLRNYTQNIDTLERVAGIERVIECHGSFATASCTRCQRRVRAEAIRADILGQRIPLCAVCAGVRKRGGADAAGGGGDALAIAIEDVKDPADLVGRGIMKPDIVFFGESLPDEFHATIEVDKRRTDLVIVIGSSLKVSPVALIPSSVPAGVPQVLINREQLDAFGFDVELLGDSDVVVSQLCHM